MKAVYKQFFLLHKYANCIGMILSLYVFISFSLFSLPVRHIHTEPRRNVSIADIGDGPANQCFISLTPNVIDSGIEFFLCHMDTLFQEYVGYTHNIMKMQDAFSVDYVNLLYMPVKKLAFLLLPLSLLIAITMDLINSSLSTHHTLSIEKHVVSFLQSIILILVLPFIYEQGIDLNNTICQYIINLANKGQVLSISGILTQSIHASQITANQFLPSFVETILWIGLFVSILYILGFFIVRFILIWIMFLAIPLLIPGRMTHLGEVLLDGILTKTIQFIIVQPIFLFGLDFFLLIMRHEVDSIAKLFLAIGSLFTLGFLPSFIAGIAGGKLANISTHEIQEITHGLIQRGSIVIGWMNEPKVYEMPFEKPDKK